MASWTLPSAQQAFAMEIIKGRVPSHSFPRTAEQAASFQRDMDLQRSDLQAKIEDGAQRLVDNVKAMIARGVELSPTVARNLVKFHADRFTPQEMTVIELVAQQPVDVEAEMLAMAPKFNESDRIWGEGVWEKRGTHLHGIVTKKRTNQSYTIKVCDTDSEGAILWDGPYVETVVMTPFGYSHNKTFKWKSIS